MNKKYTQEIVSEEFKQRGCILIGKYVNPRTLVLYRCKCQQISQIRFDNFKRGSYCKQCGIKKITEDRKHSYEFVYSTFQKNGYLLLDKEYKNNESLLSVVCPVGHKYKVRFGNFNHGNRCKICMSTGEKNNQWQEDRNQLRLNQKIRKKCYSMLQETFDAIGTKKNDKSSNILGYTPDDLKQHLITHVNWLNVKNTNWQLDHKFPIKAFMDHKIHDVKIINCLENLQPMSANENMIKGDSYDNKAFQNWLKTKMEHKCPTH